MKRVEAVRRVLLAMLGVLCAGMACAGAVSAQEAALNGAPVLEFAKPEVQARLGVPYQAAVENLLVTNTVSYGKGAKGRRYNQTGLLSRRPGTFVRAGGGYKQPWTRDASVNSWNAASLLEPGVARNTLWAVVKRESRSSRQTGAQNDNRIGEQPGKHGGGSDRLGRLIVQQDNQWWDQTIWVVAAWNHTWSRGTGRFWRWRTRRRWTRLRGRSSCTLTWNAGCMRGRRFE